MPQISALFLHDHKLISYRRKFIQILQSGFGAINLLHPNLLWTKAIAQSHRIQQVGQARDHHLHPRRPRRRAWRAIRAAKIGAPTSPRTAKLWLCSRAGSAAGEGGDVVIHRGLRLGVRAKLAGQGQTVQWGQPTAGADYPPPAPRLRRRSPAFDFLLKGARLSQTPPA